MPTPELSNRELDELLPAYVNGTLSAEQRSAVETYLADHPDARAEVEWLRELRSGMRDLPLENAPGELGWQRLRRNLPKEVPSAAPRTSRWWKPAMAAAALIIVVQAALLAGLRPSADGFQPLSGPVGGDRIIQIQFQPTATEAQIRQLLQQVDGQLVDGPSAIGLYHVRIGAEGAATPPVVQALETLRAHSDVVAHAATQ